MSAQVVWDIVRRESSFLKKSFGIELSAEPLNVVGKNSYKHSGLSQPKALGVVVASVKSKGDKIKLLVKNKATNKPAKSVSAVGLTHGRPRASKAINGVRGPLFSVPLSFYFSVCFGVFFLLHCIHGGMVAHHYPGFS